MSKKSSSFSSSSSSNLSELQQEISQEEQKLLEEEKQDKKNIDLQLNKESIIENNMISPQIDINEDFSLNFEENECNTCNKKSNDLLICGKCQVVYYCNIDCQTEDWKKKHKNECKKLFEEFNKVRVPPKQRSIDNFKFVTKIGEGNFSEIMKGTCKFNQITYAIKVIPKLKIRQLFKEEDVFMEKYCLEKLKNCKYVVKLHDTFQDELNLYMLLELITNGELWERIKIFGIEFIFIFILFF